MQQTMKEKVSWYTMKMRIYPSAEQAKQFDRFFLALQLAYNMTFHEVFLKNPNVCQEKEGVFWPDYEKMGNSAWRMRTGYLGRMQKRHGKQECIIYRLIK